MNVKFTTQEADDAETRELTGRIPSAGEAKSLGRIGPQILRSLCGRGFFASRPEEITLHTRSLKLERAEAGPIPCVLATTTPVMRNDGFGETYAEVLTCSPDAVDLTRAPLPVLISHNANDLPVGQIVNLRADGRALRGDLILGQSTRAKELEPDLRSGLISSLSVGYSITKHTRKGDTFTATRWQPHEVSLVAIPADPQSGTYRSKSSMNDITEIDDTETRLTRSQRRAQREQEESEAAEIAAEERNQRMVETREERRVGQLTTLLLKANMGDRLPDYIRRGVDIQTARNEVLDLMAERSSGIQHFPHVEEINMPTRVKTGGYLSGSARDTTDHNGIRSAMVDGLAMRSGVTVKESRDARQFAGLSLVELASRCLGNNGVSLQSRNPSEILSRALTTSHFPLLLSGLANKVLQSMREMDPATHQAWVKFTTTPNFKSNSRPAISSAPSLALKTEGSEVTYGTLAERGEAFSARRYARALRVTREAMVNDDLRSFEVASRGFAQAALRLESDLAYEQLTSNPTMADSVALFHATHGNLLTGATTAFDATNALVALAAARAAMRKQRDPAGHGYLDVKPAFLILPVSMETLAESIITSLSRIDNSNPAIGNPSWIRQLQIVTDPRLDAHNAAYWYLAGNHMQVDTVEIAHLEGTAKGFTTVEEVSFATDDLDVKATWEGGCAVIDWAGLLRSNGA